MDHLIGIAKATYTLWTQMGIYLVFGFAVAGILSRFLKSETIARHLGRRSTASVVKASLLGVPLPLCSCGVIPVGLSLFRRGASRGAATSFLISTPQTGVDSILVTYGMLGPLGLAFAIIRPVAAFLNGLLGGVLVNRFVPEATESRTVGMKEVVEETRGSDRPITPERAEGEDATRGGLWGNVVAAFRYGFLDFPREIAKWLVIGIVIAGVIAYLLPVDDKILTRYLGTGILPMVVVAFAAIPFYICATASVPFVAVLLSAGLSPGAGLVFLMAGPATNTATLVLLSREIGKAATAIYLASILVTSFAFGGLLDLYFRQAGGPPPLDVLHQHEAFGPLHYFGSLALLATVATAFALIARDRARERREAAETPPAKEGGVELAVTGMTCENCARHVREAALQASGVEAAHVDLRRGILHLGGPSPDLVSVRRNIEAAGYGVEA